MKHWPNCHAISMNRSPPARGRGLKPVSSRLHFWSYIVAPRAGAWIETTLSDPDGGFLVSPPARGRGLKHFDRDAVSGQQPVAPRAGAWIET